MHLCPKILAFSAAAVVATAARAGFSVEEQPRPQRPVAATVSPVAPPAVPVQFPVQSKALFSGPSSEVDLLGKTGDEQKTVIEQVGIPNEAVGLVSGFGRDLPFTVALRQVVPEGWRGYTKSARVKSTGNVTWFGLHRPWISVLNNLLADNGMRATLDWNKREILISDDPSWTRPQQGNPSDPPAGNSPVLSGTFELKATKTLCQNLQAWVDAAKWTLSWEKNDLDYPGPNASVVLSGELIGDNGVIKSVIDKYSHARRPLEVKFYTQNRVVRVTEGRVMLPGTIQAAK